MFILNCSKIYNVFAVMFAGEGLCALSENYKKFPLGNYPRGN